MPNRGGTLAVAAAGLIWAAGVPARAAKPLPAPKPPPSFLVSSSDQLGFPGEAAGTEVTPEGDLFTGWAELAFTVGAGKKFDPTTHSLAEGRFPIVRLFKLDGNVLYQLEAFEYDVANTPVTFARVSLRNLGTKTTHGRVSGAVRYDGGEFGTRNTRCCIRIERYPRPRTPDRDGLYWQPGAGFSTTAAYSLQGTTLLRDGSALVQFPGGGPGVGLTQQLQTEAAPFNTRSEFGRHSYDVLLKAHQQRELTFTMPVEPVAPTDPSFAEIVGARYSQYRAIARRYWAGALAGAMRVSLPERKVVDTFYTSIMNDLLSRYRVPTGIWVQAVNQMRYHAFWLRDASFINQMYLLTGLRRPARENLDFFFSWQRDDGLFISRPEEYDGFGEALWAFGEYVRRTGDTQFARDALPAVSKAMGWFDGQRSSDNLGLMPPVQNPGDNELIPGHLAGDNFLAVAGVAGAVEVARAAGDQALTASWQSIYNQFLQTVRGRVFFAQKANHGIIPPTLDNGTRGQDWGNLWASYPWPAMPADSAIVRNTIVHVRRKFREGIATYADRSLLHHYLGFRVFETELMQGKQKNVVDGLYSELAHTTGTNAGWEAGTAPFGDRVVDDTTVPHGWFAAEYATLLRNMLVREEGNSIVLMGAVSPSWLGGGKRISVGGVPTPRGPVSFTLTSTGSGATLRWSGPAGTRFTWPVPYLARGVRASGLSKGAIALHGRSGTLHVRWRLVGKAPTYADAFHRLMTAYFNSPTGAAQAARAHGTLPTVPSKVD